MYGKQTDFTATAAAAVERRDDGAELKTAAKKRFKWNEIVVFWNFLPYSSLNICRHILKMNWTQIEPHKVIEVYSRLMIPLPDT